MAVESFFYDKSDKKVRYRHPFDRCYAVLKILEGQPRKIWRLVYAMNTSKDSMVSLLGIMAQWQLVAEQDGIFCITPKGRKLIKVLEE